MKKAARGRPLLDLPPGPGGPLPDAPFRRMAAAGPDLAVAGPDPPAIRFAESNLQTFPPPDARGKISGAYRPPTDADGQISRPRLPCPSRFSSDLAG